MRSADTDIAVILLAAGASRRFGKGSSKLLEPLGNRKVIDVTVNSLQSSIPNAKIILVSSLQFNKECGLNLDWVEGGTRRQDSAKNGILSINANVYLIHDAARPFVSKNLVERLIQGLLSFDGVAPGLSVTDTIKRVSKNKILCTLNRNELYSVQTPQALKGEAARKAFSTADWSIEYTDDLAVLEAAGFNTGIVEGDRDNIKITTLSDISKAEEIYKVW